MENLELKSLILNFRKEDMLAFEPIYSEFKRYIRFYSKKLGYEDALQELTLFLIELLYDIDLNLFKNDLSDGLSRYIAVSIRNKYIALSKENSRYALMCTELYESEVFYTDSAVEKVCIEEALSNLTNRQRLIIIYKYILNYSDAEISSLLGISRQAVNRIKNRAFSVLRNFYK